MGKFLVAAPKIVVDIKEFRTERTGASHVLVQRRCALELYGSLDESLDGKNKSQKLCVCLRFDLELSLSYMRETMHAYTGTESN